MNLNRTPQTGGAWIAYVNAALGRLEAAVRGGRYVPVGATVLWPGGGTPPPGWLLANGAGFSSGTYPLLAARLGSTTLPNPAAVSGIGWIIRAQ